MKNNKNEWKLFCFGWLIVLVTSMVYWYNDDPEFQLAFSPANIALVLCFFVGFLMGLGLIQHGQPTENRQKRQGWQYSGFAVAIVSFCLLASVIYYLILGLLFALLVATFPNYLRTPFAWTLAIVTPLLAGIYDVLQKDMPFYLTTKLLFVSFNCLVLQFGFKTKSEQEAKERSHQLLRELQATQTLLTSTVKRDERLRIARDLHDSMGHKLTALKLQLELISHLTGAEVQDKVNQAKQLSGQILEQVRHNVTEYRDMSDIALGEALQKLTQAIPGLAVELNSDFNEQHLTTRQAEAIFRCAQEAITNVLKHSTANQCTINLLEKNQNIILSVKDNGEKLAAPPIHGNGLHGMQERARNLDGEVDFQNDVSGSKVVMTLPLNLLN